MNNNLGGLEEFQSSMQTLVEQLKAGAMEGTQAAGEIIFAEIHQRAKGTVRESLALATHETETGARAVIKVENSEPGGKEHHAVFLEYGTSRMAAEPFMRPGFDAAEARAVDRFTAVLTEKVKG